MKKTKKKILSVPNKRKTFEHWKLRGFSSRQHAEGFHYMNRSDTEEDLLEIDTYCGEYNNA